MLHRLGSIFFLLAMITSFFKFKNNKLSLKLHIVTGTISAVAMIVYSITDYIKDKELTILPVGIASLLIILSGNKKVRKKYKWLHIVSVIGFAGALAYHIIN